MYIQFAGANREVTGSCHLLEVGDKKILVDCGMFQGGDFNEQKNHDDFPFDPHSIDAVLVTHAHLDHVGRIPKLIKEGFAGRIYMTEATKEFARLIWEDAYRIMEYNNRKFDHPILYDMQDIAHAIALCHGIDYHDTIEITKDITAIWYDVGHIFGSAFVVVRAEGKTIAFSGDVGNDNVPILKTTEKLPPIDYLLCESTYGDRVHEDIDTRRKVLLNLIVDGVKRGGTIMVPAFSLERTQEFLYELNKLSEYDKILPQIPIFLDSPLAIDATDVYKKYPRYYDSEAKELHEEGDDFLQFPQLQITYTKQESQKINHVPGPKMVIAGAGMMNGGRILHHAIRYLPDPHSTLIIVGYQAHGTLGRALYEGARQVKIFGEHVDVRCTIQAIGALSAHGDREKLLRWIGEAKKTLKRVFLVHGEDRAMNSLYTSIHDELGIDVLLPKYGERVELA